MMRSASHAKSYYRRAKEATLFCSYTIRLRLYFRRAATHFGRRRVRFMMRMIFRRQTAAPNS